MTKTNCKKLLSVFLSLVMVFSVISVAFVNVVPTAKAAAVSDAQWDALIAALKLDGVKDTQFVGDGTNAVKANDPSGNLVVAADAYYDVLNTYKEIQTGNGSQDKAGADNRTSSLVKNYIQSQLTTKMGADFTAYNVASVLSGFNANYTNSNLTSSDVGTSSPGNITLKVTVTNSAAVLGYDSFTALPDEVPSQVTYTYTHGATYYTTSESNGCGGSTNTNHYYAILTGVTRVEGTTSTSLIKNVAAVAETNADAFELTFDDLVNMPVSALEDLKATFKTPLDALYASTAYNGQDAYDKYLTFTGVVELIADIDAALAIAAYVEIAEWLQSKVDVNVNEMSFEDLSALYFEMDAKYNDYMSAPSAARTYLQDNSYIDIDAVSAKFDEIVNAYEIAYLRDVLKPRVEGDLAEYAKYDDDWTIATDGVEGIIAAAELELNSIIADLNSRKKANVEHVFGADYIANKIQPVLDSFARIREVNGYNLTFKDYQKIYNDVFAPLTLKETSTQLLNILNQKDNWYTELKAFVAELSEYDAELAAKIFTDAEAAMEAKIDQTYAALNAILEAEINDAWALYEPVKAEYGTVINEVTMENYVAIKNSVGLIEVNVYNFLYGAANFNLSEEAVAKYEELKNIVKALENYSPSKTLSAYNYNKETLEPIIRYVNDYDMIRDLDFEVKEEYMQEIMDLLNDILTGGLADLGLDFNLVETLDSLWDMLYSDSFVNTILNLAYPLLAGYVRDALYGIEGFGDFIGILGDLDDAFQKVNAGLAPKKVAVFLGNDYPDIKNKLASVTGADSGFMYGDADEGTNCWNTDNAKSKLYKPALDENGEVLRDENGKVVYSDELDFDWGIDAKETLEEKREATLKALDAGLNALKPLFLALLCNVTIPNTQIISIMFGAATGSIYVAGNDGYNNTLAPILEALGVREEAIYDAKTFTSVRDIIEFGLLSPIEDLFDQIKADPAGKILDLLPNLAFAIHNDLVLNLLHELKLVLELNLGGLASIFGGCIGDLSLDLDIGNELKLDEMLDMPTFYEDVTSLDGLIKIVIAVLTATDDEEVEEGEEPVEPAEPAEPALKLPHLDGVKLAMLGTDVVWGHSFRSNSQIQYEGSSQVRANIVANRPQVVQFLLEYIADALDPEYDLVNSIINMINAGKEEDEDPVVLPGIVNDILANIGELENRTDVIAAIFELMHPVEYSDLPGINWITVGNIGATDYEDNWTNEDADGNRTLWTKEKAVYLAEHIEDFIDDIIVIFGEQLGGVETLGDLVDSLLNSLFTADNANSLVEMIRDLLGGLLGTADEDEEASDEDGEMDILSVLTDLGLFEQLDIDLTAWDDMEFSFADGDKAAFKNALIDILNPLNGVLAFILADENIELNLLGLVDVGAPGHDGYSWGLVPLLEALGATGLKTTSAFLADKDNIVKNIVDPLFSIVDNLQKNPLKTIEDLVPSLLYFVKVEGIQTAVEHLLYPVNQLLDVIRPVMDVNIYTLVSDELGVDLRFAENDPLNFIFITINDLLRDKFDIDLGLDFTVDSLTELLHFTDPQPKSSANGQGRYTISLTTEGKADLISNILNFGINQVIFGENYNELMDLLMDIIPDDDIRALVRALLDIINDADSDYADFHGIHDVALASIFWLLFGADSVTDAVSDFFYRYKDVGFFELLYHLSDKGIDYVDRVRFLLKEAYRTEYPAIMDLIENADDYLKPPYEYTEEQQKVVSGVLARIIVFFETIFKFLRSMFNK